MIDGRIPRRRIGASDLEAGAVGVGTWQWGDRRYWDDHDGREPTDIPATYQATMERGADFLDTAELYGFGESERVIATLRAGDARPAVVATKYMPSPTRWRLRSVDAAIDGSLKRLGADRIDHYQVHWPYGFIPHRRLLGRLAQAVHDGRLAYVGVSNFTEPQMRRAHAVLADAGVPLVSNQVSYSLLRRAPEVNGVLDACHELDVTLIAYSPLAQGLLSGKYGPGGRQPRSRPLRRVLRAKTPETVMPLLETLRRIGESVGASAGQIAVAWTLRDSAVLPIVGARTAGQAQSNADAALIDLDDEALRELDIASDAHRSASAIGRRLRG